MDFVARFVRTALDHVLGSGDRAEVILRHGPSGFVLTDGASYPRPVRFASAADAATFCRRFLDEAPAWQAVEAAEIDEQAA